MKMKWRIDQFLYEKEKPLWRKISLFPLQLLSYPYGGAARARVFLYDLGLLNPKRLPCPVISVGNLTVGGTGKTPLVMALARGLLERGVPVAILSRGYKGKGTSGRLVSDGQTILFSAEASGDEAFLMAQTLKGIPVFVGKDRVTNGQMALQQFNIGGLILDDGYQYLPLHRDLNILLIDSRIGFGDGHVLPRGILREPLTELRRADLFFLTKVEDPERCREIISTLQRFHPKAQVFHSHYEPIGLVDPKGELQNFDSLKTKSVLALSGLANPSYFSSLVRKCGMEIVEEIRLPDHHHYTRKDLTLIERKCRGMNWIVTTEKDMVKLTQFDITHLPIRALRIEMKVWEEEEFYKGVLRVFPASSS